MLITLRLRVKRPPSGNRQVAAQWRLAAQEKIVLNWHNLSQKHQFISKQTSGDRAEEAYLLVHNWSQPSISDCILLYHFLKRKSN